MLSWRPPPDSPPVPPRGHPLPQIYTPLIFGHCQRHGLQKADAAAVAQDVMSSVATLMPSFEYNPHRGNFRGWLLQTTRYRLYALFVSRNRPMGEHALPRLQQSTPDANGLRDWNHDYQQRPFVRR